MLGSRRFDLNFWKSYSQPVSNVVLIFSYWRWSCALCPEWVAEVCHLRQKVGPFPHVRQQHGWKLWIQLSTSEWSSKLWMSKMCTAQHMYSFLFYSLQSSPCVLCEKKLFQTTSTRLSSRSPREECPLVPHNTPKELAHVFLCWIINRQSQGTKEVSFWVS